jgi:hypothetical protein
LSFKVRRKQGKSAVILPGLVDGALRSEFRGFGYPAKVNPMVLAAQEFRVSFEGMAWHLLGLLLGSADNIAGISRGESDGNDPLGKSNLGGY